MVTGEAAKFGLAVTNLRLKLLCLSNGEAEDDVPGVCQRWVLITALFRPCRV